MVVKEWKKLKVLLLALKVVKANMSQHAGHYEDRWSCCKANLCLVP